MYSPQNAPTLKLVILHRMTTVSFQLFWGKETSRKVELLFETKKKLSSLGRLEVLEGATVPNKVIPMTKDLSRFPVDIIDFVAS
jgi:hypothetical protein